eukprot:jgi/Chrzof1/11315/Cz05g32060.t1
MRIRGLHKRHTVAKSGSDAFIFEVEGPPDKPDANEHTMITRYNELLRDSELIQELRGRRHFERPRDKAQRKKVERIQRRKWEHANKDWWEPETLTSASGQTLDAPYSHYYQANDHGDVEDEDMFGTAVPAQDINTFRNTSSKTSITYTTHGGYMKPGGTYGGRFGQRQQQFNSQDGGDVSSDSDGWLGGYLDADSQGGYMLEGGGYMSGAGVDSSKGGYVSEHRHSTSKATAAHEPTSGSQSSAIGGAYMYDANSGVYRYVDAAAAQDTPSAQQIDNASQSSAQGKPGPPSSPSTATNGTPTASRAVDVAQLGTPGSNGTGHGTAPHADVSGRSDMTHDDVSKQEAGHTLSSAIRADGSSGIGHGSEHSDSSTVVGAALQHAQTSRQPKRRGTGNRGGPPKQQQQQQQQRPRQPEQLLRTHQHPTAHNPTADGGSAAVDKATTSAAVDQGQKAAKKGGRSLRTALLPPLLKARLKQQPEQQQQ